LPVAEAGCAQGPIVGALPLVLIRSPLTGRRLVSVPCGVGGGIIADDVATAEALHAKAMALAQEHRCAVIDYRSERAALPQVPVVDRYVGFRRELPDRSEDVLGWLPRKARAAARNGRQKFGLEVEFGLEHLDEVWRLYTASMRRLASLNYPRRFFEELIARPPGRPYVSRVRWQGSTVAGLVSFGFKDAIHPYFIGTTDAARACSAANFIYLTLAEQAAEDGYRVFDFGRSRRDNAGSFDFKRFHGFEPRPLAYQQVSMIGTKAMELSPSNPKFRLARRLWTHLPLGLTRRLGARLTYHIPG
jgi:FemAB-related protein (PEP-CTERM system-associated)